MRVRKAIWRVAGPTAGRLAPAVFRVYYRAVVASLVRELLQTRGVVAVYAHGSYATGSLRPGRSDVDLDVVIGAARTRRPPVSPPNYPTARR